MAHWIIEDHGFDGQTYRCSNCRNAWNDLYYDDILKDRCPACSEPIDKDADEYIEEIKKFKNVEEVTYHNQVLLVIYKKGKNNLLELIDYLKSKRINYTKIFSELYIPFLMILFAI